MRIEGASPKAPQNPEEIHREWTRNVRENRPDLRPAQLERTRRAMDAAVPDCLVEGYEGLVAGLTLPDADDRHVLAAAIRAGASLIVTFNLADFPRAALAPHGVAARHPDDFVLDLIELDPAGVCEAVERQRGIKKPAQERPGAPRDARSAGAQKVSRAAARFVLPGRSEGRGNE